MASAPGKVRTASTFKSLWGRGNESNNNASQDQKSSLSRVKVFLSLPVAEQMLELTKTFGNEDETVAQLIQDAWINAYVGSGMVQVISKDKDFVQVETVMAIVDAAPKCSTEALLRLLQIVTILCRSSGNQALFAKEGGITMVVRVLQINPNDPKLMYEGVRALSNLSVREENKALIVRAKGVEALTQGLTAHLQNSNIVFEIVKTLRNLALNGMMNAGMLSDCGGLVVMMSAMAAHSSHAAIQQMGCATICNLTGDDAQKDLLIEGGAVARIVVAMGKHNADPKVQIEACAALGNLCILQKHKGFIMKAGVVPNVLSVMANLANFPRVLEQSCRVLSYLASSPEHVAAMAKLGAVSSVIRVMKEHSMDPRVQEYCCQFLVHLAHNEDIAGLITTEGGVAVLGDAFRLHASDVRVRVLAAQALNKLQVNVEAMSKSSGANVKGSIDYSILKNALDALPAEAFKHPVNIVEIVVQSLRLRSSMFEDGTELEECIALFAQSKPGVALVRKDNENPKEKKALTDYISAINFKDLRPFASRADRGQQEAVSQALTQLGLFCGCLLVTPLQMFTVSETANGESVVPYVGSGMFVRFQVGDENPVLPPVAAYLGDTANTPVPLLVFLRPNMEVKMALCRDDHVIATTSVPLDIESGSFQPAVTTMRLRGSNASSSASLEFRVLTQTSIRYYNWDIDRHKTDRYGFPLPRDHYIPASKMLQKCIQNDRDIDVLLGIGARGIAADQAAALAMNGGFSSGYRSLLWRNAVVHKYSPGLFATFPEALQRSESLGDSVSKQVDKDLERTFPDHPYYQSEQGLSSLRRVLRAVALETHVGYCQSMNFIAGLLLLIAEEDLAYWLLACVVKHILPDYFGFNLIGVQVDTRIVESVVIMELPVLKKHFDHVGFPLSMLTSQWFMCLYIGTFPTETTLAIWDAFFTQGRDVLLAIAIVLLRNHQEQLLPLGDIEAVLTYFKKATSLIHDYRTLIHQTKQVLSSGRISGARASQEEEVQTSVLNSEMRYLIGQTNFTSAHLFRLHLQYTNAGITEAMKKAEDLSAPTATGESYADRARRLVNERGLTSEQFVQLITTFGLMKGRSKPWAQRLLQAFDTNDDGSVDFRELCVGLHMYGSAGASSRAHFLFQAFDTQHKGHLTRSEMRDCLDTICTHIFDSPGALHHESFLDQTFSGRDNALDINSFERICRDNDIISSFLNGLPEISIPGDDLNEHLKSSEFEEERNMAESALQKQ